MSGGAGSAWHEAVRTDPCARERFVEAHLDLVRYLAARIAARLPSSVELEDLVHDGIVGLLHAIAKYDPRRGVRFRTYAEARIRGAILDGLRQRDWRSRGARRARRELVETIERLTAERGRAVEEEEIAAALGCTLEEYRERLRASSAGPLLSLEELPAGLQPALSPSASDPGARLERRELVKIIVNEIARLPERERHVLALYYCDGLTMKEIGSVLGVTESRICQLHSQAVARLQAALAGACRAARDPAIPSRAGGR